MILLDAIANTTIAATIFDGVLVIADHPLLPEDTDELMIIEANEAEITELERAGYHWKRVKAPD